MKTIQEIQKRLEKLRSRHLQDYVEKTIGRRPHNCIYNHLHTPQPLQYKPNEDEFELSPRVSKTLVVIQNESPVRLCLYGMNSNNGNWNGDVCDRDTIAQHCKMFEPKHGTIDSITSKFDTLLADDKYVLENYPDIAALQWVLNQRVYNQKLGFFDRLLFILTVFFIRRRPLPRRLYFGVAEPKDEAPEEYWNDSD